MKQAIVALQDDFSQLVVHIINPPEADILELIVPHVYNRHSATKVMAKLGYLPAKEGWTKELRSDGSVMVCMRTFHERFVKS